MNPLVSIIMPTYNRKHIIHKAIGSVLNQSYDNWELIIIDDYGNDGIKSYIEENYQDARIRCLQNTRRKGISGARNTGILNANGEYIAFLDSDDLWEENHLSELIYSLEKEKVEMGFALWKEGPAGNLIGIDSNSIYKELLEKALKELKVEERDNYYIFYEDFYEFTLITYFYCYHINTMVIKTNLLLHIGLFDELLSSSEDYELLCRLLCNNPFLLYKGYHYNYIHNSDSTYAFIDRSNIDVRKVIQDREIIDKFTKLGIDRIKVYKRSYQLIKDSKKAKDLKKCKNVVTNDIGNKYLTLSLINSKFHKVNSIRYLLKALRYKFKLSSIYLIVAFIMNKKVDDEFLNKQNFDFS